MMIKTSDIVQHIRFSNTSFGANVFGVSELAYAQKATQRMVKPAAFVVKTGYNSNIEHPYNTRPEKVDSFDVIMAIDNRQDQRGDQAANDIDDYFASLNSVMEGKNFSSGKNFLPMRQVDFEFLGANLDVAWWRVGYSAVQMAQPLWEFAITGVWEIIQDDFDVYNDVTTQMLNWLSFSGLVTIGIDKWKPWYWLGGADFGEFEYNKLYVAMRCGRLGFNRTNPNTGKVFSYMDLRVITTRTNHQDAPSILSEVDIWLHRLSARTYWQTIVGNQVHIRGRAFWNEDFAIDYPDDVVRLG